MKHIIIVVVALLLIIGGALFITGQVSYEQPTDDSIPSEPRTTDDTPIPTNSEPETDDVSESETQVPNDAETVIGQSAGGNDITAYHYGSGDTELLFIGGIHAGYSWNTVLVAYELMDYLDEPNVVPENVRVTVIPTLNPDAQEAVIGTTGRFTAAAAPSDAVNTTVGRFNDNGVDLNRNFDCQWQAEGVWQNTPVSGGSAAFSESEAAALRDYVANNEPDAVVAYYAAAGGVYASTCSGSVASETMSLMNTYANASGYTAFDEFDYYEVTGDMVNWFAKLGVPAVSVLLTNHTNVEWSRNEAGIAAVLAAYAE